MRRPPESFGGSARGGVSWYGRWGCSSRSFCSTQGGGIGRARTPGGLRFLVIATVACLAVLAASDYVDSRWFVVLAMLGVLIELPAVLLGPHTSLMLVHLRHTTKIDATMNSASPITFADMQINPSYSPVSATWELLLFKLPGGRLRGVEFLPGVVRSSAAARGHRGRHSVTSSASASL